MQPIRRIAAVVLTAAALGGTATAMAAPASADPCSSNNLCLYYFTNYSGSHWANPGEVPNYNLPWIVFNTSGAGNGQRVNDNAASLFNGAWYMDVQNFENSWFRGRAIWTDPGYGRTNLGELANQLSSHTFFVG
jgi:hypothetical protein